MKKSYKLEHVAYNAECVVDYDDNSISLVVDDEVKATTTIKLDPRQFSLIVESQEAIDVTVDALFASIMFAMYASFIKGGSSPLIMSYFRQQIRRTIEDSNEFVSHLFKLLEEFSNSSNFKNNIVYPHPPPGTEYN